MVSPKSSRASDDADFEELFRAVWADVAADLTPPGEELTDETALLDDGITLDELREGIREGLRQALNGEGMPIETLWDEIDSEF